MRNMEQIMAHLLWEFDMELDPKSEKWSHQKTGLFPYRGPLFVHIVARQKKEE
jgi:hypothetical protein